MSETLTIYFTPDERDLVSFDFTDRLGEGETISSATVAAVDGLTFGTDNTFGTEIPPGSPTIDDPYVSFWVKVDANTPEGVYPVKVLATINGAIRQGDVAVIVERYVAV